MSVYINDRPLAALVYGVNELDGHLAPALPQRAPVPLANSAAIFGTTVTVESRSVVVGLDVRPTTLVNRQTLIDTLKRRMAGLLELRTDDLPGRVLRCLLAGVQVELYTAALVNPACYITLTFTAVDPARHDVEPLVYGLSTARTVCPVGTDTSAPRVWLFGAATAVVNPAILVRSLTGAEVARMTFTVSLAQNDALVIDAGTQQIERYVAGVLQIGTGSGLAALTSGRFPILSPEDAADEGGTMPTVELTATSGTPTGLILYTRRWA